MIIALLQMQCFQACFHHPCVQPNCTQWFAHQPRKPFIQLPGAQTVQQVDQVSDILKPLHLKVVCGRKCRFQSVDVCQGAEAPRKVRRMGFSFIMYSRKLRGGLRFNHESKEL